MTSTITIHGIDLQVGDGERPEARITSEELGRRLEYGKRQQLEELANRHAENLSKFGGVLTVSIPCAAGARGRAEAEVPTYNRSQALYLVAKSQQPKANELTVALIQAFEALERMIARQPTATSRVLEHTIETLAGAVAMLVRDVQELKHRDSSTVTSVEGAELKRRMLVLARKRVRAGLAIAQPSSLRAVQNRLGAAVGWFGKGCAWDRLPVAKLAEARRVLVELESEVDRVLKTQETLRHRYRTPGTGILRLDRVLKTQETLRQRVLFPFPVARALVTPGTK